MLIRIMSAVAFFISAVQGCCSSDLDVAEKRSFCFAQSLQAHSVIEDLAYLRQKPTAKLNNLKFFLDAGAYFSASESSKPMAIELYKFVLSVDARTYIKTYQAIIRACLKLDELGEKELVLNTMRERLKTPGLKLTEKIWLELVNCFYRVGGDEHIDESRQMYIRVHISFCGENPKTAENLAKFMMPTTTEAQEYQRDFESLQQEVIRHREENPQYYRLDGE